MRRRVRDSRLARASERCRHARSVGALSPVAPYVEIKYSSRWIRIDRIASLVMPFIPSFVPC